MKATELLEKLNFDEMSNLSSKTTGLPVIVWVNTKGATKHGPRIKVNPTYSQSVDIHNLFTVTIEEEPKVVGDVGKIKSKDIKKIVEWVLLNKEVLLEYWNYKFTTDILMGKLKPIK